MDIAIEKKKGIRKKHIPYIAGGAVVLALLLWILFGNHASTLRVESRGITIVEVRQGEFNDYVRVDGQVQPIEVVQISPEEGGIVREKVVEEGAHVKKGDVIVRLSNSDLDLQILDAEAQLAEKQNFLRNTQVSMEQDRLNNMIEKSRLDVDVRQKQRTYLQYKRLYEEDLVSREEYLKAEEDYRLAIEQNGLVAERLRQDSIYRSLQMAQLESDLENMRRSLSLIRERRAKLTVSAPVAGELGFLDVELGQNISVGQMVGRINVLTGHKIEAEIDEHYIDRVVTGLSGEFDRRDTTFSLKVKKVYPDVREGKFQADLEFVGEKPSNIRNGQSYYINLQLGESSESVIIPRGSFFSQTGGTWIFVLDAAGERAVRREIRLGRQNPQCYEVLEGISPGEQVIVSGYELFGNNDELILR